MTTGIYLDQQAEPAERYKIATGSNGAGAVAVSADGIHWKNEVNLQNQTHGRWDTPKNAVWDAQRRQWIMYLRSTPTDPAGTRIQAFSHSLTSDYMGEWSPASPTGLNSSSDYQPDGLVVWEYEGIFLGIGNVLNGLLDTTVARSGLLPGNVNMVLAWSADGRRWRWIEPNESLVPLGAAGEFDTCGVFGAKQDPLRTVVDDDTMRLYYAGCSAIPRLLSPRPLGLTRAALA